MNMLTVSMPQAAAEWLTSGRRGVSSETLFSRMTGLPVSHRCHPWDPADLDRCRLLLEAVPEWRARIHEMAEESPEWAALVGEWDALCSLMDAEAPRWRHGHGSTPLTYRRMKELIEGARKGGDK